MMAAAPLSGPSYAQTETPAPATRIEVDENAHVIRFYINGEPAALLNADGLHVVNNVQYGGMIADRGEDNIQTVIKGNGDE